MPRSDQYGAAGETWRHINQSDRVPPDRRLIKLASVTPLAKALLMGRPLGSAAIVGAYVVVTVTPSPVVAGLLANIIS